MNTTGFIMIPRTVVTSDFWGDKNLPFSYRDAYIHVVIGANWQEGVSSKNGHTCKVRRGQLLTSIRSMAVTFNWDKHKVYEWLKYMDQNNLIRSQSLSFGTLLTVENYDDFQGKPDTVTHTPAHAPTHEAAHEPTHEVAPRYKNIEQRKQTEESLSAPAEPPPDRPEPAPGSAEWYAAHYDD